MPKSSGSDQHLPTALVAGAGGFVGSHLCDALISQNCLVYGLDNWSTGKKDNLKHLLNHKNFVFLDHDLNQPLKTALPVMDYIFHLAGIEAYVNGLDISLETLLVNSIGTKNLLEIAKKNQAKFLLGSTIDIYSGFVSTTDLNQYFSKTHTGQEAYSHHEAKRFSEALTFEYFNRHHVDARIVRLGHLYGPKMSLESGSDLAILFKAALEGKPLVVGGQGMRALYPTYITDLIYGLTKAMFSQSSEGQIYTLINPQKTTMLNFANKVKKAAENEDLNIEFSSDVDELEPVALSETVIKSQQELGWSPKVTLEAGISKTLSWLKSAALPQGKKTHPIEPPDDEAEETYSLAELGISPALPNEPPQIEAKPKPKREIKLPQIKLPKWQFKAPRISLTPRSKSVSRQTKFWILGIIGLLFFVFGPLVLSGLMAAAGVSALQRAKSITTLDQPRQIIKLADTAAAEFSLSRKLLRQSSWAMRLIGLKTKSDNFDRLLSIGVNLSQGGKHLAQAGEAGTFITQIVLHHKDGNLTEALKQVQLNLDQAYSELSFVESELQSGRQLNVDFTSKLTQEYQDLTATLPVIRQKMNQLRNILPLVPGFVAQDGKKTYLVLFQNSAEIRPTGGFIGSYGLLTFEKGKLLDFSVEDIYSADGQLKGFVEPPEPIKEFLGQNTWFFRDSNWDPDFTVSAERAEWFLQKTTDRNVDGVVAVNLPAVKHLLAATGPLTLSDYNEEVTAENLFDRAEYRSEIDFFPGSTQKKDFLGALAREIFNKAQSASGGDLIKFAQAAEAALAQKQILIYLHDADSQKLLLAQNWAGGMLAPNLKAADARPVLTDYNFLVEANLGINKANYFLRRAIKQQLTILKNKEVLTVTTVNYQNQSPADAWPGGVYKTYLRDYIPAGSNLVSIKIDQNKLNLGTDVDITTQADKFILGFPVSVPVKGVAEVEITYRLPGALENKNNLSRLAVVIPKQPGIIDDPLEVIVNHPTYLTVAAVSPQALVSPQVITWKTDLLFDRVFTIDFIEK
jgi:nucleoside-diphosphate-sugar epimerase